MERGRKVRIWSRSKNFGFFQIPNWFHFSCFFKKNNVKTFTDIGGFDSLRWEDQEKVKGKVGGGGSKGSEAAAAASNGVSDDLQVEYAKSKRSKCKNCKEQIDKVRPCSSYMYLM